MKKFFVSITFLAFASILFAQTDSLDYYLPSKAKLLVNDRVSVSMTMGAGLSFLNNKNSAFTTFIAPKIGYQLTPDLKLNFGLLHYSVSGNTLMLLDQKEALFNTNPKPITGNLLFAGGEYKLNKRLILSGTLLYDAAELSINKKDNYKAASLVLEFKTTENSSIKFQTTISNGQGNYYNNPNPVPANGFNSFGTGFSNENLLFR